MRLSSSVPVATLLTGVPEAAHGVALLSLLNDPKNASLYIVLGSHTQALETLAEDTKIYAQLSASRPKLKTLFFPESSDEAATTRFEAQCDRLTTLSELFKISAKEKTIIYTTPAALFEPCPPKEWLKTNECSLQCGEAYGFETLKDELANHLNYDCEALCEGPGQYALRGGLIDVYPLNAHQPYRIDFFGDEIESIRPFNPTTQHSLQESIASLTLTPLIEGAKKTDPTTLWSYLEQKRIEWVLPDPNTLEETVPSFFKASRAPSPTLSTLLEIRRESEDHWWGFAEIDTENIPFFKNTTKHRPIYLESLDGYRPTTPPGSGLERMELEQTHRRSFLDTALKWQSQGDTIWFSCNNEAELSRLKAYLKEQGLPSLLKAKFIVTSLSRGFRARAKELSWPSIKDAPGLTVITDGEIFGRYRNRARGESRRTQAQHAAVDQLLNFSELVTGDALVHISHGICLFQGLQELETNGSKASVITLEFADGILLHLPLHESHLLSRYVGLSKSAPRLAKLGGSTWGKTKKAAEKATFDFAGKLLSVQAQREMHAGHACSPDHDWQKEFEAAFLYKETPDQFTSIAAIKEDMERPQPMDRLLCGDVGFGKTEVALRAAFKAVMDGKQVAVLVPTTVLCQQHFNTFCERMADYPITVEMLSRFRTPRQQKKILESLPAGKVDILIGTHRLLSSDIAFKDLGLLVIDEEHRFGVKHKEQIKALRASVDVLAMSATPIPRSLYLALVGARDLSVIETPPTQRLPIQTLVKSFDWETIQKAIEFEIRRGGQVFYLHNRVGTIEAVANKLRTLMPQLKVAVGHGQMTEGALEGIMTDFVAGKYDVLVSTTIIESGLDIPNCNTILIEGADRFGLAQLYQLRGRVGRFKRQAYAYLFLHRHARVLEHSRKRLSALKQHNQLGAGYRIAMRDLELRGAGNILGSQQSGHIAGIGFELYCQLLRQSIQQLKGEGITPLIRAQVRLDFVKLGEPLDNPPPAAPEKDFKALKEPEIKVAAPEIVEAYIPQTYIPETRLRIDFYRKLALVENKKDLNELRESLVDRFGEIPKPLDVLILTTKIRCIAEHHELISVQTEGTRLMCQSLRGEKGTYLKRAGRFPRLTQREPFLKLKEILKFIENQAVRSHIIKK